MNGEKRANMHRADIVAALRKKNLSLSGLGREHNLSPYTLKNALDKPYPKAEKIIADAIGLTPQEIWPGRY
ncbi:DNA-binding protein [Candidatus Symbiopectobacterium sp. 'North America']|uniref:helix-turn-helix domain-containing protein n=1 Tax=Candidatus Symbiopectobacterium sp. 'North America' TaxID=2794574 RepID=UPI0018CBADA8|nr:helix-turn-helix transcriptional regulator [Candidatus Symbiopectobacterium sp. 'North America']MBG6244762.1 DNA-binding protein [Candidatus Symbiopectobacterium sp. 'North America']